MEMNATLPPESARLLEGAASGAEEVKRRCEGMISSPVLGYGESVIESTGVYGKHLMGVLGDPFLQQWMDPEDRRSLSLLQDTVMFWAVKARHALEEFWEDHGTTENLLFPYHSLRKEARLSGLLLHGTRWSLRNRIQSSLITRQSHERPPQTPVHIRWMNRSNIRRVLDIEEASSPDPWDEEELIANLRPRNAVGMVAEAWSSKRIIGFNVYELHKNLIHILRLAVDPDFRGQGVGTQMAERLISRLSCQKRRRIVLGWDATQDLGLRFAKREGFRAVACIPHVQMGDAYLLEHRLSVLPGQHPPQEQWMDCTDAQLSTIAEAPSSVAPATSEWDPSELKPWDPQEPRDHAPYGLWSGDGDGEE